MDTQQKINGIPAYLLELFKLSNAPAPTQATKEPIIDFDFSAFPVVDKKARAYFLNAVSWAFSDNGLGGINLGQTPLPDYQPYFKVALNTGYPDINLNPVTGFTLEVIFKRPSFYTGQAFLLGLGTDTDYFNINTFPDLVREQSSLLGNGNIYPSGSIGYFYTHPENRSVRPHFARVFR